MNEAKTRAEHIDSALRAAGWGVVEGSRCLTNEDRWTHFMN
jgi:type I restriction enzyme R subunit